MISKRVFQNLSLLLILLQSLTGHAFENIEPVKTNTSNELIRPAEADSQISDVDKAEPPDLIQSLLQYALSFDGARYRRGGTEPEAGFDCSGFVRHVFDHVAEVGLPHSASAISKMGSAVKKSEFMPGDLVFFHRAKKRVTHVGIFLGDNQFIHASSRRTGRVMISSLTDRYWGRHLIFGRRIDFAKK